MRSNLRIRKWENWCFLGETSVGKGSMCRLIPLRGQIQLLNNCNAAHRAALLRATRPKALDLITVTAATHCVHLWDVMSRPEKLLLLFWWMHRLARPCCFCLICVVMKCTHINTTWLWCAGVLMKGSADKLWLGLSLSPRSPSLTFRRRQCLSLMCLFGECLEKWHVNGPAKSSAASLPL